MEKNDKTAMITPSKAVRFNSFNYKYTCYQAPVASYIANNLLHENQFLPGQYSL